MHALTLSLSRKRETKLALGKVFPCGLFRPKVSLIFSINWAKAIFYWYEANISAKIAVKTIHIFH